jgi:hypothetical protein
MIVTLVVLQSVSLLVQLAHYGALNRLADAFKKWSTLS